MARQSPGGDTHRARRRALLTKTSLHSEHSARGEARVRNISESGLGGVSDIQLLVGQYLTIDLAGIGPVPGYVVWVKDRSFGMKFFDAINMNDLRFNSALASAQSQKFTVAKRWQPVKTASRPAIASRS